MRLASDPHASPRRDEARRPRPGASGPLVERLASAPDLLTLHALDAERYPFLLESGGGASRLGRYDILFAFPGESLRLDGRWRLAGAPGGGRSFLGALDAVVRDGAAARGTDPRLPFSGGWFVYLGYELAREIEPRIAFPADPAQPVALAVRIPAAVVHDRLSGRTHVCAESGAESLLAEIRADLDAVARGTAPLRASTLVRPGSIAEEPPARFLDGVRVVQRHIAAGDVYQANISRRWTCETDPQARAWMVHERLRRANPAPFGGIAKIGDLTIISSSPERRVKLHDGRVETRPIAGTRPRVAWQTDDVIRSELVANRKERAEHVMLIDLERNDLGRVCRAGTVLVDEFMVVESYAHVHHIVSNVTGELRANVGPGEVLRAVFPGGTITGCPKVRCMEIIREIEGRPRGAYTGAMGYLNHDGSGDLSILIRTMTLSGTELSWSAGSGIVADSVPAREIEETRAKAKGMALALED
jgi:anthranilate synthase component 1